VQLNSDADKSFLSKRFSRFIKVSLPPIDTKYSVELVNGKLIRIRRVIRDCELELLGYKLKIDLMPTTIGCFDIFL
jgi:hypothetical protein